MKTREELIVASIKEPTAQKYSRSDSVVTFTKSDFGRMLSAPTEEQRKCEYCHEPCKALYSESDATYGLIDHKVFGVYADDEKLTGLKFPYCPQCGRKLKERVHE